LLTRGWWRSQRTDPSWIAPHSWNQCDSSDYRCPCSTQYPLAVICRLPATRGSLYLPLRRDHFWPPPLGYRDSYVTIAAAGASTAESGFLGFEASPPVWPLPIRLPTGIKGTFLVRHWPHYEQSHEPISTRAWTLQEELLSPRILRFPSKICNIEWSCNSVQRSDCGLVKSSASRGLKLLYRSVFRSQIQPSPLVSGVLR
jgi:hypothetical protein